MNFAICANMDRLGENYAKSERERQIVYDLTYMWNLKSKQTNKLMDPRKQIGGYQRKSGELNEMGEGVKKYKLPSIKQISHGDVMYSMGTIVNNSVLYI